METGTSPSDNTNQIDSGSNANLLQMGFVNANVARAMQIEDTNAL